MFREIWQIVVCLSMLVSTCVSLHMVRDAYHRPTNEQFRSINHAAINIVGSRNADNNWFDSSEATTKNQNSIDENGSKTSYKALNLEFERLNEPLSSGYRYGYGNGNPTNFLINQKRKILATNRLDGNSKQTNARNDIPNENEMRPSSPFPPKSTFVTSKTIIPMSVSLYNGLLPLPSVINSDDRFPWEKQVQCNAI